MSFLNGIITKEFLGIRLLLNGKIQIIKKMKLQRWNVCAAENPPAVRPLAPPKSGPVLFVQEFKPVVHLRNLQIQKRHTPPLFCLEGPRSAPFLVPCSAPSPVGVGTGVLNLSECSVTGCDEPVPQKTWGGGCHSRAPVPGSRHCGPPSGAIPPSDRLAPQGVCGAHGGSWEPGLQPWEGSVESESMASSGCLLLSGCD